MILENLLPNGALFEILHATSKRVLWSSWIEPGKAKPIHTVTLDEPLVLLINLKYCRTVDGLLIHKPAARGEGDQTFAGKIQKTLEGFLEEGDAGDDSVVLTGIHITYAHTATDIHTHELRRSWLTHLPVLQLN